MKIQKKKIRGGGRLGYLFGGIFEGFLPYMGGHHCVNKFSFPSS